MTLYKVRFEYLLDEQADIWELPIEATDEDDARARIQRNRAPLRVLGVERVEGFDPVAALAAHLEEAAQSGDIPVHPDRIYIGTPVERCCLCRRTDVSFVSVDMEGAVRSVCDTCWGRVGEGIEMPLDYSEVV